MLIHHKYETVTGRGHIQLYYMLLIYICCILPLSVLYTQPLRYILVPCETINGNQHRLPHNKSTIYSSFVKHEKMEIQWDWISTI